MDSLIRHQGHLKKQGGKEMNNIEKIRQEIERLEVDLEEEADRMFFSLGWYEGDHHQPMLDCVSLEQFRGIARHFVEWSAKNAKYEKPSEDLEEAAEDLFETIEIQEHENIFEDTFKKIFIAGAEWQKKQQ